MLMLERWAQALLTVPLHLAGSLLMTYAGLKTASFFIASALDGIDLEADLTMKTEDTRAERARHPRPRRSLPARRRRMPARPAEQRRSGAPARRYRRQHRRAQPTRQGRQPARRPGLLHRGFLLLGRQRRLPRRDLRLAPGRRRGPPDAQPARAPVPRPHADQGARHPPAHALAPGPALLQHRRPAERQLLDPGRSRCGATPRWSSSPARTGARG
jgi:hypothetical protein